MKENSDFSKCEKCGANAADEDGLVDYCYLCSTDLCRLCMARGCCGHRPALSGMARDEAGEKD